MKVNVESNELYPFYYLSENTHLIHELELTEDEVAFVNQTMVNFWEVQKLLAKSRKTD